ncbi:Phosphoinositide phosphatase SAC2 [Acorus calamus]|uniref:Phosphoinositide phosphatase SAC2 n=1 Tax=Acorus calamus TaxID=4465 RepID=A0AAV9E419_ACOCL|nr:Phosphoinositide phosphatase SAC2 [Acorus calamus]
MLPEPNGSGSEAMVSSAEELKFRIGGEAKDGSCYLHKFRLYETRSKFYMVGRDKSRALWRVLKIDRLEPSELSIREDSTRYSESECYDLLKRIHEGNRSTGGLKFITNCYGIVGFVKFLGPYYMLLITKRRQIGDICGHNIYAVTKSEMIALPNPSVQSNMANSKIENRSFVHSVRLSISGKDFKLTLIARRSRHYAGTRYLKRGVNEKGRVANDVETEQIVSEHVLKGCPEHLTSVVQNRGSIPLFWSQETSRLNIKPDIILQKKDQNFEATHLHFENLVKRYGNPIIILNLIKTREKKPRESILRSEFANAIDFINKDLPEESRLKFLHWDLNKHSRRQDYLRNWFGQNTCNSNTDAAGILVSGPNNQNEFSDIAECGTIGNECQEDNVSHVENCLVEPPMLQNGVLRTNCIDCLDRTNVAQYAYGLAALGHQLHALGIIDIPRVDLDAPLADDLMSCYETMGDTLALQYGGSAAHNKIFSERRGQWKAATQSQEFFRTLQRYYSNAYMDAEKQDAINVFLGHFQPQEGKPALWELDSDQHYSVGMRGHAYSDENTSGQKKPIHSVLPDIGTTMGLSESTPEISTCDSDMSYSRSTFINSPVTSLSTENVVNGMSVDTTPQLSENGSSMRGREPTESELPYGGEQSSNALIEYNESFVQWVNHGDTLCF